MPAATRIAQQFVKHVDQNLGWSDLDLVCLNAATGITPTLLSGALMASSAARIEGTPTGASAVVRIDGDLSSLVWFDECEFVSDPVSFTVGLTRRRCPSRRPTQ